MPQSNNGCKNTQQGNVFLIILIGVVLFGALGFTFSRSANKGTGNLTKQQAKIAAQEILNYAYLVEGAVDRVRRKGCSETEISFDNSVVSGYTNPNSPIDKSCHIFDSNGGKIEYFNLKTDWLDTNYSLHPSYNEVMFIAENTVLGLQDNIDDIVILFDWLKQEICIEINKLLFSSAQITEDPGSFFLVSTQKAVGTFDQNGGVIDLTSSSIHGGKEKACFTSQSYGSYHFYNAILPR